MRRKQYEYLMDHEKTAGVRGAEQALAQFNSRSANFEDFKSYCFQRYSTMQESLEFYGDLKYRHRNWKSYVKRQKSESGLFNKIKIIT